MSKDKKEKVQANLKALRAEQARKDKRAKIVTVSVVSAAILAFIGLVVFIVINGNSNTKPDDLTTGEQSAPITATANGAFLVASDSVDEEAKRVDIFFDPMCPGCGVVDRAIGDKLSELVDNGEINLYLSPVSFLDITSSDQYSTRAINAFITVAEYDPRLSLDFMNAIFEKDFQPAEGTSYISVPDESFVEVAKSVGVPDDIAESITQRKYVDWIKENSETQTNRRDLFPEEFSTPSVFVGVTYDSSGNATGNKVSFASGDVLGSFEDALK